MKRIVLLLLSLCAIQLYAQSDSLSTHEINEVVVEDMRQPLVRYNTLGKTYWSVKEMNTMPMNDPLRNIQLLPGVQTTSENVGGVFVQGCDNSHNYTTINGVPIYYPIHLLGCFSTFNNSYFENLAFNKSMHLTTANRLGAEVGVETDETIPDKLGMNVDLGLLIAQGSLRVPLGEKLSLAIAGRYSDVNLIYDNLINSMMEDQKISYSFYDVNMGLLYKPTERDNISVDYFSGCDYAEYYMTPFMIYSGLEWGNRTASLRWKRDGDKLLQNHSLYYTSYRSVLELTQTDSRAFIPANIQTFGVKSEQRYLLGPAFLTYGGEAIHHIIVPQAPQVTGSFAEISTPIQVQQSTESSLYMQADIMLNDAVEIIGGFRASGFYNTLWKMRIDPRLTLRYQPTNSTTCQLAIGSYTQYLHQVGFSSNGLPSEFWISSGSSVAPQYADKVSLALQQDVWNRQYRLSVEAYLTRLTGQVEYKDNALGLITQLYDLNSCLVVGKGYNYGVDLMLQKNQGKLTGWVSYSWAKAPRAFMRDGEPVTYTSVHNREHDLNVVVNWHFNKKWNFSATYIYATGTPYTEVKTVYFLGENLIVNYEKHNGARYPALTRLDLALGYQLPKVNGIEHSVKFSVYNATFAKTPISYRYQIKNKGIYKQPVYLFPVAIPSVSYFMSF